MEGFFIKAQKASLLFVIITSVIMFASCNADNTAKNEEKDNQSNITPTVFVKNEKEQVPLAEDIKNGTKEEEAKAENEKKEEEKEEKKEEKKQEETNGIPPTVTESTEKKEEGVKIISSLFDLAFVEKLESRYQTYIKAEEQIKTLNDKEIYTNGMLEKLKEGEYDVYISSNSLNENEKKLGLKDEVLAYEVGALVVNPSNPVKDITTKQLSGILNGTIKNWSQIGGNDMEIKVVYSMKDLKTKELLAELIGFNVIEDGKIVQKQMDAVPADTNVSLVKKVSEDPSAIGIITPKAGSSEVRLLNINGVVPSGENIKNGSYMFQKTYRIYHSELTSDYAKKLLEYLKSDECKNELMSEYFLF